MSGLGTQRSNLQGGRGTLLSPGSERPRYHFEHAALSSIVECNLTNRCLLIGKSRKGDLAWTLLSNLLWQRIIHGRQRDHPCWCFREALMPLSVDYGSTKADRVRSVLKADGSETGPTTRAVREMPLPRCRITPACQTPSELDQHKIQCVRASLAISSNSQSRNALIFFCLSAPSG